MERYNIQNSQNIQDNDGVYLNNSAHMHTHTCTHKHIQAVQSLYIIQESDHRNRTSNEILVTHNRV